MRSKADRRTKTKMTPRHRIACLQRGKAIATLEHDYEKALKEVATVLKDNPLDIDALILRGNILDLSERFEASRSCYDAVLRQDGNNTRALIDMGDWFSRQGRVKKALSSYDRALTLLKNGVFYLSRSEELEEAYLDKILLLREAGRLDEAQQTVNQALASCPRFEAPRLQKKKQKKGKR